MSHEFTRPSTDEPQVIGQSTKSTFELENAQAEIPFSLYQGATNHTYTEEFFKITDDWRNADNIQLLEDYIASQIGKQSLHDSTKSYEQLIQDLFAKIGVKENETEQSKFAKVIKFISLTARNRSKDERQRELIKRQKEVERIREERRQALLKNNLDKVKEEKTKFEKELLEKNHKLKELEKSHQAEVEKNQANQERIERLIETQRQRLEEVRDFNEKSLQQKLQLQAENERLRQDFSDKTQQYKAKFDAEIDRLYKELHATKLREQILLDKHNKLKQFIQ